MRMKKGPMPKIQRGNQKGRRPSFRKLLKSDYTVLIYLMISFKEILKKCQFAEKFHLSSAEEYSNPVYVAGDDDEEDQEAEEGDNDIAPEDGEQEGGVELPGKNIN